jgi:predicted DNA-binding transcriptional regulator AlpA
MASQQPNLTGKQKQAERKKRLTPRRTFRERLGISTMTMWRREQEDDFPNKIYVGKSVFFDADEVELYIDKLFETRGKAAPPLFNKTTERHSLLAGG